MKSSLKKILVLVLTFVIVCGTITASAAEPRFIYLKTYNNVISGGNSTKICHFEMQGSAFTLVHNATWEVPSTIDPDDCEMEVSVYYYDPSIDYTSIGPEKVFYVTGNEANATEVVTGLENGKLYAIHYKIINTGNGIGSINYNVECSISGAVRV